MENYIVINGKKIELPQEVIDNITEQLKSKVLTYEDIVKTIKNRYYINTYDQAVIDCTEDEYADIDGNEGISKEQMECLLARNMLVNVATYLNDGWMPITKSSNLNQKFYINNTTFSNGDIGLRINYCYTSNDGVVFFKSKELAQQAIEILGEETIRKALTGNFKK